MQIILFRDGGHLIFTCKMFVCIPICAFFYVEVISASDAAGVAVEECSHLCYRQLNFKIISVALLRDHDPKLDNGCSV